MIYFEDTENENKDVQLGKQRKIELTAVDRRTKKIIASDYDVTDIPGYEKFLINKGTII